VKGATLVPQVLQLGNIVSIHAPREGSDQTLDPDCYNRDVSIHAPREGSDVLTAVTCVDQFGKFQSTLPVKGATRRCAATFYT
jgi:hypothetical protein